MYSFLWLLQVITSNLDYQGNTYNHSYVDQESWYCGLDGASPYSFMM
jgi:hypothetical protein